MPLFTTRRLGILIFAEERIDSAFIYAHKDSFMRYFALIAWVTFSTFHRKCREYNKPSQPNLNTRSSLTKEEEDLEVYIIVDYSSFGHPLRKEYIRDVLQLILDGLPYATREKVAGINEWNSIHWAPSFLKTFRAFGARL